MDFEIGFLEGESVGVEVGWLWGVEIPRLRSE